MTASVSRVSTIRCIEHLYIYQMRPIPKLTHKAARGFHRAMILEMLQILELRCTAGLTAGTTTGNIAHDASLLRYIDAKHGMRARQYWPGPVRPNNDEHFVGTLT